MMPQLNIREAAYDRYRDAVVIPAGRHHVAIAHNALESWFSRSLTPDEAVEAASQEKALLARVANTIAPHDNMITITTGILNSRSWDLLPGEEE